MLLLVFKCKVVLVAIELVCAVDDPCNPLEHFERHVKQLDFGL